MIKRNRLQEDKDYTDLMLVNELKQVNDAKKIINESSLDALLKLFNKTENIGVISMSEEDTNVRNPLITLIENKFKSYYDLVGYNNNNNNNNGNGNGK